MPTEKRTAWILLRGLAREQEHWGPFLEQFRSAHPHDDVLPIDLPGVGEFHSLRSPTNMGDLFTFVRAKAIERARSQSQFKLLAVSLGGMVAMEWMNQRPEDLAGVVMVNTSTHQSPVYNRLRWQVWSKFLKVLATQSTKDREKMVLELTINSEEARAKALPIGVKLANERPISYLNFANQLWAATRFAGLKHAVNVPVLLLNSLGDRFVDPSCSTVLHEKWGWPIERHAWGGHDLTWDDGAWVLNKIAAWDQRLAKSLASDLSPS